MKFALLIYIVADDFFYITLFLYLYLYLGPIWSVAKGMFGVASKPSHRATLFSTG
jgi:hypothetical protein